MPGTIEQRLSKQRELLTDAVSKLRTEEGWQNWIRARSRFHGYSFSNTMLIAAQDPEATRVRGFVQWKKDFNRQVTRAAKGHGIGIFAPMTKKLPVEGTDEEVKKLFFRVVRVFDIRFTIQIPDKPVIPVDPPSTELEGDSHAAMIDPLVRWAQGHDIQIEFNDEDRNYYDRGRRMIIVGAGDANQRLHHLVHELSHAEGEVTYDVYERADAEVICEAAAFITCSTLGLDTSKMSVPYIAGWSELAEEKIRMAAAKIDEIATALITHATNEADPASS